MPEVPTKETTATAESPFEEMENSLAEEAVANAKKTLSDLVSSIDPKSNDSTRALHLVCLVAQTQLDMVNSFVGDVMPKRRRKYGSYGYEPQPMTPISMGGFPGTDSETFGNQVFSQMMELGKSLAMGRNDPSEGIKNLTEALATAKRAGLDDVCSGIRKKLEAALSGNSPGDAPSTVKKEENK